MAEENVRKRQENIRINVVKNWKNGGKKWWGKGGKNGAKDPNCPLYCR
jgi:hypothetical protein